MTVQIDRTKQRSKEAERMRLEKWETSTYNPPTEYMEYKVACYSCDTSCNSIPFSYYYLRLLFDHFFFLAPLSFRFGIFVILLLLFFFFIFRFHSMLIYEFVLTLANAWLYARFAHVYGVLYAIHRKRNMLQNRRIRMSEKRHPKHTRTHEREKENERKMNEER